MRGVKASQIASYVLLPGIIPRTRALFGSGFGYVAFLMAHIYNMVRLLPPGHPYLLPQNIGRFGIRHVVGEAANHLVPSLKNIDQIIIFIALLAGIIIMLLQILLIPYAYFIRPALAATPPASMFLTPKPANDIAFQLLDRVFGVPKVFCNNSGADCSTVQSTGTFPWPFHDALHSLLQFYSLGLLIVATLIFLYFVVVVVAETATTGTPFGQRFQNVWVPIRLVVALGLLVPLNYGINSAQYITLYAAKFGSGLATNGWIQFNAAIKASSGVNPIGESKLLAKPESPDIAPVVQFMSIVDACAYGYWVEDDNIHTAANPVGPQGPQQATVTDPPPGSNFYIKPYFIKQPAQWLSNQEPSKEVVAATSYDEAMKFYGNGDIIIRFGRQNATLYKSERGNVSPLCGEIRIPITDLSDRASDGSASTSTTSTSAAVAIQKFYFDIIKEMWFGGTAAPSTSSFYDLPQYFMELASNLEPHNQCTISGRNPDLLPQRPDCDEKGMAPSSSAKQKLINSYQSQFNAAIINAWTTYNNDSNNVTISQDIIDRGWAGAGIWYNKVADINGAFVGAILALPSIESYPKVMEEVREENRSHNSDVSGIEQFTPNLANSQTTKLEGHEDDLTIAQNLNSYFKYWNADNANQADNDQTVSGNVFQDAVNMIFGTYGLFAMRGENAAIHPLAQLSALGKGLVDNAIRNVAVSSLSAALGGPASVLSPFFGALAQGASSFLVTTAFIGLTAGFTLYYVMPFLPFLYFMFAVGSWIKTIFEAMVGVPLWALAHLRLDGEGLPGQAAAAGYFLIFEIFARPIMIVFGLIAAIVIFGAEVRVLNFIWDLVVDNITGYQFRSDLALQPGHKNIDRNVIDEFFFTLIYVIIVYMMGSGSFKLVDTIPGDILRWMGGGVTTFSDINQENIGKLQKYVAVSGLTVGSQITGSINQLAGGVGGMLGGELQKLSGSGGAAPTAPPSEEA